MDATFHTYMLMGEDNQEQARIAEEKGDEALAEGKKALDAMQLEEAKAWFDAADLYYKAASARLEAASAYYKAITSGYEVL